MIRPRGKEINLDVTLAKLKNSKLPVILANMAKNHFLEGFEKGGGMTDFGNWAEKLYNPRGKKILVDTGRLRRDIKVRKKTWKRIVVGSGLEKKLKLKLYYIIKKTFPASAVS